MPALNLASAAAGQHSIKEVERLEQIEFLNREAKRPLSLDVEEFTASLPRFRSILPFRRRRIYRGLGRFVGARFTQQAERKLTPEELKANWVGTAVMARMLSYAPFTYLRYCQEADEGPELDRISEALKANEDLPQLLSLPLRNVEALEENAALKSYMAGFKTITLGFAEQDDGSIAFSIDEELMKSYTGNPIYQYQPEHKLRPYLQRCPARRLVTERIWPAMVDLAVQTPEVFPRDLGLT